MSRPAPPTYKARNWPANNEALNRRQKTLKVNIAQRGSARLETLRPDDLATMERYHRRSRVETKMHWVKLLGQRLAARDFDRQVAEFQVRVAVLNSFTALGTPVTEAMGKVCPAIGNVRPSADL